MTEIILSFSPKVFPSLLTGEKRFEYRSCLPEGDLRTYLYLSSPVKALVGYLDLGERLALSDLLASGLVQPVKDRLARFTEAYASPIKALGLFEEVLPLEIMRQLGGQAPQSFAYAKTYPLLADVLQHRPARVFSINPDQDLEGLGWFSQELLAQYPQVIPVPDDLLCHFPKEKI